MRNAIQVRDLFTVLEAVYASLADPGTWDEASSHLAVFFQADAAIILCASRADDHLFDAGRQVGVACYTNIRTIDKSLITQSLSTCAEHRFNLPPIQSDRESSSASVSKCRRQVNDQCLFSRHFAPSGACSLVTILLHENTNATVSSGLSIYRNGGRIRFINPHRRILAHLLPHLQRAYMLQTAGRRAQRLANIQVNAIENLDTGICLLNTEGEILYLNSKAKTILMKQDGLGIITNKLIASSVQANKIIARQIEHVIKGGSGNAIAPRSNGKPSYRLTFKSAVAPGSHTQHNFPVALVLIEDPEEHYSPAALVRLSALYRLTPAESRVVRMLAEQDLSPNAIAETLNRSIKTVRAQLAVVFSKTGAKNQQELLKLIYRS